MAETLTLTITLDAEQFEDDTALAFFMRELNAKRALVKIDGYAFDGWVAGMVRR